MGFLDKAKEMAEDAVSKTKDVADDVADKANEAIHSEKAEQMSDSILNKVNELAGNNEAVKNVTDKIDKALGNE
ncbi:MAG: hypothetical protein MR006_01580 [Arcanobacterium sp.]|nr:hypothetical protein [Arcanobacterium sp.]MDY5589141.1 hypothetical protein [Arcanobacterium sp.]